MKVCNKCKEQKELSAFYKRKDNELGMMARCKDCVKKAAKQLKYRPKKQILEKSCGHCKQIKMVSEFHKAETRLDGFANRCKDCKNKYRWSKNGKYHLYKREARNREVDFSITKEFFLTFWQKACTYCGEEIQTIGLDRVNSSLGYIEGNICSCCSTCNYMKRNHSLEKWFKHIKKVLDFQDQKGD